MVRLTIFCNPCLMVEFEKNYVLYNISITLSAIAETPKKEKIERKRKRVRESESKETILLNRIKKHIIQKCLEIARIKFCGRIIQPYYIELFDEIDTFKVFYFRASTMNVFAQDYIIQNS